VHAITLGADERQRAAADTSNGGSAVTKASSRAAAAATTPHDDAHVAFCLSVKGEHRRIREWVAYCGMIGAGRLYVDDDGSSPPLRDALADFVKLGLVRVWVLGFGFRVDDCAGGQVIPLMKVNDAAPLYKLMRLSTRFLHSQVEYRYLHGRIGRPGEAQHVAVYNDCIRRHGHKHKWMGASWRRGGDLAGCLIGLPQNCSSNG